MDGSVLDDSSPLPPELSDITYQQSLWWRKKGRNTISPYLTFLPSPHFHPLSSCLRVPPRLALSVFSFNVISHFHTFIRFLFCFLLSFSFRPFRWPSALKPPPSLKADVCELFSIFTHVHDFHSCASVSDPTNTNVHDWEAERWCWAIGGRVGESAKASLGQQAASSCLWNMTYFLSKHEICTVKRSQIDYDKELG